jgi:lycopene beta-cyclase
MPFRDPVSKRAFDAVVVGGGLSGLSLASRMVELRPDARIAVVDADFDGPDHKLWSWWDRADRIHDPFPEVPRTVWRRMRVADGAWERTESLGELAYATMRSDAFRSILTGGLRAAGVTLISDRVQGIVEGPDHVAVVVDGAELVAPHAFQSMTLTPGDRARPVRYPLRQHFGGWVVRTPQPAFDPEAFTLMDFDVTPVEGGLAFVYVLPFSRTEALFEYTVFSPEPLPKDRYDQALTSILNDRVSSPWEVVRTEYGVLPMEERIPSARWGQRVFNIGAVGGAMKPSTGYAFARIQRQVEALARSWAAGNPEPAPAGASRFAHYDALLLRVLMEEPQRGAEVFRTLFRNTRYATVLRFLDEQTSWMEEAQLLSSLPWGPFVRGLLPLATLPLRAAA